MRRFGLSERDIDVVALSAALQRSQAGALCCFEGWVRDHNEGRTVIGLCYEAYVELAGREGEAVLSEAMQRFEGIEARCIHRIGELRIGERAVWVGVSAAHRDAAFAACRWIIDEIKSRVPIWKHERYAEGEAQWLHPGSDEPKPTP